MSTKLAIFKIKMPTANAVFENMEIPKRVKSFWKAH